MSTTGQTRAQRPTLQAVIGAVEADCKAGLAELVWVTDGFEARSPTSDADDPIGNSTHTVVSWSAPGIHGAEDQPRQVWDIDKPMRSQMIRTHRWVSVRGVTIVDHSNPDPAAWTFERHVDWNGLASQIGVAMGCLASDPTG